MFPGVPEDVFEEIGVPVEALAKTGEGRNGVDLTPFLGVKCARWWGMQYVGFSDGVIFTPMSQGNH